jgi:hypothetical protein
MTLVQIEKRVRALESRVRRLVQHSRPISRTWYRSHAGRFAGDPVFEDILDLGRAYRKAQSPRRGPKHS